MPCRLQDEATVKELATDEKSSDVKGFLHRLHAWLFEADIFASVASDPALLCIHSTAEEFEPAAEECFAPFQVSKPVLLPLGAQSLTSAASSRDCLNNQAHGKRNLGFAGAQSHAYFGQSMCNHQDNKCMLSGTRLSCIAATEARLYLQNLWCIAHLPSGKIPGRASVMMQLNIRSSLLFYSTLH